MIFVFGDFLVKLEVPLIVSDSDLLKDFDFMFNKGTPLVYKDGATGYKDDKIPYKGGTKGYKAAEILNKGGLSGYKGTDIFNKGGS